MWVLAELLGCCVIKIDPYQGAKCGNTTRATYKTWNLGETIVLLLLDVSPQKHLLYSFHVQLFYYTSSSQIFGFK